MISGTIFDERPDALGADGRGVLLLGLALRRPERRASTAPSASTRCGRTLESLAAIARTCVSCYPNAGMPDGFGGFHGDTPSTWPRCSASSPANGWLNIVGGCCGTTPEWIAAIAEAVEGVAPRKVAERPAVLALQRHRAAGRSGPRPTSS